MNTKYLFDLLSIQNSCSDISYYLLSNTGVLVDSPRIFISDFSISGFDDTMSRVELYGCQHLPDPGKFT